MGRNFLTVFIIALSLFACTPGKDKNGDQLLARVNEQYLYLSDVKNVLTYSGSGRDSITLIQNFVNNWVQQHLIIEKARENLPEEELDFSKQLEEYRNSLIIFTYETRIVEQYLDTLITSDEIEQYYQENPHNFELADNILMLNYVKLHVDSPEISRIRNLIRSEDPEQVNLLEDFCEQYATEYWLEDEWLFFDDIIDKLPFSISDQERFLQQNRDVQNLDHPYWYLIHIKDYKLRDDISPLELERENIKKIILNKRKLELIKTMREDLFRSAVENNEVEIY